jgi:WD40 repeat protein
MYAFEDFKDLIGEIDEFFDKQTFKEAENVAEIQELDEIYCLTELQNGDIITGLKDSKIRIWNLKTKNSSLLLGHTDSVLSILELKNNEVVSGSKDKTIIVWNIKTFTCSCILTQQNSAATRLIHLKNSQIDSGCSNGQIYIWDMLKKTCIAKLEQNNEEFISVLLESKMGQLVSVSFNNRIRVWNLKTNKCINTLEPKSWIKSLIQFNNGFLVSATISESIGKIFVWNNKKELYNDKIIGPPFNCLIQLKSGEIMTGSTDGSLKIFETQNFSCLATLKNHRDSINCLTQLKNGQVLSGSNDKTVKLWDTNKRTCIGTFQQNSSVCQVKELKNGEVIFRLKDNQIRVLRRKRETHDFI